MSTVAWQSVWSLFEEVIGLPAAEQPGHLDRACGDDALLRQAVEKMLEADRKANNLLDQPIVGRPEPAEQAPTDTSPPGAALGLPAERIGAYRLLRKIGQGGMSTVYLAVRDDDTFRRRVVVKLIRRGLETEPMIHRLRVERQILASLTHPHIARLYDGGATEDGLPYFIMEYVEGETIDVYCSRNYLSVDERVDLFLRVCDAVRYAHQNLVVHRDLKPANIMVSSDGEPKLLDFGIAKLLNPELVSDAPEPTATWHGALTPSYASPEQIRGKLITTTSDVYSLGVVLYRLLTGKLPYDFKGLSPSEIERLITETEPTRPSSAVGDVRTDPDAKPNLAVIDARQRALAGDLDAIVLKALRSTPGERYPSVEQLATDLENFRQGLPVTARQGTWRYRAGKFVRRNRMPVLASAVVGVVLAILAATIAWQSYRIARESEEVKLENAKKTQVQALIVDLFELSNPHVQPGKELTVREALERSAPLLASELRDQPDVRAELLHTTGSIRLILGDHQQAASELEEAHTLRLAMHGADHPDTADTANGLALALAKLGELDRAETLAHEGVAVARRLAQASADDAVLVGPLVTLVSVYCYRGRDESAVTPALEAYELIREAPDAHPYDININELLGSIYSNEGDYEASVRHYREAVALRRARQGEKHPQRANALNNLGVALRRSGQFDQAELIYRETLALEEANYGTDPLDTTTITKINIGGALFGRGAFAEAETHYRQTLEETGLAPDYYLALILRTGIAQAVLEQGRAQEAEHNLRAMQPEMVNVFDATHRRTFLVDSLLGASLSAQSRFDEAEPLLMESYKKMLDGAKARHINDAFERLRQHLERAGKADEIATYDALRNAS